jgi:hypothetical protein
VWGGVSDVPDVSEVSRSLSGWAAKSKPELGKCMHLLQRHRASRLLSVIAALTLGGPTLSCQSEHITPAAPEEASAPGQVAPPAVSAETPADLADDDQPPLVKRRHFHSPVSHRRIRRRAAVTR